MKRWFQNLMYKLNNSLRGRYGHDELGNALLITSLVFVLLGYIPKLGFFSFIAMAVLIYFMWRVFSKNIIARQNELNKYYTAKNKLKKKTDLYRYMWRDRKTHCYFKCKFCGAMIRVPKNKGEIEVTCPKCRAKTTKKT